MDTMSWRPTWTPRRPWAVSICTYTCYGAPWPDSGPRSPSRGWRRGVCTLKYDGPPPLGVGLAKAVKENFKDINEVIIEEE